MLKPDIKAIEQTPDDTILTPKEVSRLIGYSHAGVLLKIKNGTIKGVKIGTKWYVTGREIKKSVVYSDLVA